MSEYLKRDYRAGDSVKKHNFFCDARLAARREADITGKPVPVLRRIPLTQKYEVACEVAPTLEVTRG